MRITQEQFEEIKALVIQETGAVVSFYEKKDFRGTAEGYAKFDDTLRIFVCRSSDTIYYTRATLVLLHEYGHIIDYMKHKNSTRIKNVITTGIPGFDPINRSYRDATKLSKKEKLWILKTEWYANEYAIKFAVAHKLTYLLQQLIIEQVTDYRYAHFELIQGVPITKKQRRQWFKELKKNTKVLILHDVNKLNYI